MDKEFDLVDSVTNQGEFIEHFTTPDKSRDDANMLASEASKADEDDISGLSVITPS